MRKWILRDGADCVKNRRQLASGRQEGRPRVRIASAAVIRREKREPVRHHGRSTAQLLYLLSGQGRVLIGDRSFVVRQDSLVAVNPNQDYILDCGEDPVQYVLLEIDGVLFGFVPPDLRLGVYDFAPFAQQMRFYLNTLLEEWETREDGWEPSVQNLLELLLIRIGRHSGMSVMTDNHRSGKECAAVKRHIDANFGEEITLDSLAARTNLNKYYLVHVFTRTYGISPINYLIGRRIEGAKRLLAESDRSISQIAQTVGFSSQSYFSQSFKRVTGQTPAQYRRQSRKAAQE